VPLYHYGAAASCLAERIKKCLAAAWNGCHAPSARSGSPPRKAERNFDNRDVNRMLSGLQPERSFHSEPVSLCHPVPAGRQWHDCPRRRNGEANTCIIKASSPNHSGGWIA